jgi:thymidine kinase
MAKLFFRYGTMNSGKSTSLIQVAYNYQETGLRPFVIKPKIDTKHSKVLSRIGSSLVVDYDSTNSDDLLEVVKTSHQQVPIDCVLVEEVQFLSREQANQLLAITVQLDIPVIAYGLRTDFLGTAFPGSQRLLEIAQVIEEIRTKCWICKAKANFNSRMLPDGSYTTQGEQILIDDGTQVQYVPLCAKHFVELIGVR